MKYYFIAQLGEDGGCNGIITTSIERLKNILEYWCVEKGYNPPFGVRIMLDNDLYISDTRKAADFKFKVEMECSPYADVELSPSYDIQSDLLEDKELFKII